MKKINLIFVLFLVLAFISSCRKADKGPSSDEANTATPQGTYMIHLHTYIDTNEVDLYNVNYTTGNGRKISLSMAQLYLSELELVKLDGTTVPFTGKKILKVLETETYLVGSAPVGNYRSIRFKIGLNPDKQNPTTPSDSAVLNRSAMWFTSNPQQDGYVFLNVQGKIDTTFNASGSAAQMQPFSIKIGTAGNYKQVTMPDKNFSIYQDQAAYSHILIDYSKLFSGISINDQSNLFIIDPAGNSSANGLAVAANIPSLFRYEE